MSGSYQKVIITKSINPPGNGHKTKKGKDNEKDKQQRKQRKGSKTF